MPDYREVTIQMDYDSGEARVWCAKRTVEGRLRRLGWTLTSEQAGGTWWKGPLKGISFRSLSSVCAQKPRRPIPAALAKRNAERRKPPVE
jgi:hypothetical protein